MLTELEPYVLRYWESEFPALRPAKSLSGQRLYRRRDIETILTIKRLLYDEGFTIAGAKKRLGDARHLRGGRACLRTDQRSCGARDARNRADGAAPFVDRTFAAVII